MADSQDRQLATMMIDRTMGHVETTASRTVRRLHELIAALDRRVPQVQRAGERSIARTAAALRAEALKRIQQLEDDETATGRAVDAS